MGREFEIEFSPSEGGMSLNDMRSTLQSIDGFGFGYRSCFGESRLLKKTLSAQ